MRDGQQSLDLVVHSEDRSTVILSATQIRDDGLVLLGTLFDPEFPPRADTSVTVAFSPDLAAGAHVPRVTDRIVVVDKVETYLHWEVETRELPDGYLLRDAQVYDDFGSMRVFALEDLVASVGIGIAAAVGLVVWWRRQDRADANRKWEECLARGCSPTWETSVGVEAGLEERGPTIWVGGKYKVLCDCEGRPRTA